MTVKRFTQSDSGAGTVADPTGGGTSPPPALGNLNTSIGVNTWLSDNDDYFRQQQTKLEKTYVSVESAEAQFETFFHDFDLEAVPHYNFWTSDELENDRDTRGERELSDISRYIQLQWRVAPDIKDPEERLEPRDSTRKQMSEVMVADQTRVKKTHRVGGINFSPSHLTTEEFSGIKQYVINGHLAPGVIETIVELPLDSTGKISHKHSVGDNRIHIDEDSYLESDETEGIPVHELKAQIYQSSMSTTLQNSEVIVQKSSRPGGDMRVMTTTIPSISFKMKTAVPAKQTFIDEASEIAESVIQPASITDEDTTAQLKVKFIDPAIVGLIDETKVKAMFKPEHMENTSAIASSIVGLKTISETDVYQKRESVNVPSIASPKLRRLEYVGYIIGKYARQKNGTFKKVKEIQIPSREVDTFIDTEVKYGEIYRYRMKGVVRWNRPASWETVKAAGDEDESFGSHAKSLASYRTSYFYTELGKTTAYAVCIDTQPPPPPDELQVLPDSPRKRVIVSFKLPEDSQKDIYRIVLLKKTKNEDGTETDWRPVVDDSGNAIMFLPRNGLFIDYNVDYYQNNKTAYVYSAQTLSRHNEKSTLSEQLSARLNQDHFSRGEFPVVFISSPGVRREHFGVFSTRPYVYTKTEIVMRPKLQERSRSPRPVSIQFAGRDTMGNVSAADSNYVVRIQSLDTGQLRDINLEVVFDDLATRQVVVSDNSFSGNNALDVRNSDEYYDYVSGSMSQDLKTGAVQVLSQDDEEVFVYDRASKNDRW